MFLDDGISGCTGPDKASKLSTAVKEDLTQLGFILADEKCNWDPRGQATWLGQDWNFQKGEVRITDQRIQKLKKSAEALLIHSNKGNKVVPVRELAGVAGQVISMQSAVGTIVQLKTK